MKRHSDSTLMRMTKAELIEMLRVAEHNQDVLEDAIAQIDKNIKYWAPVRHGHWITDGSNRHECSECHKTRWVWGVVKMEYCEHCGAKMDGGNDNGKMDRI